MHELQQRRFTNQNYLSKLEKLFTEYWKAILELHRRDGQVLPQSQVSRRDLYLNAGCVAKTDTLKVINSV